MQNFHLAVGTDAYPTRFGQAFSAAGVWSPDAYSINFSSAV